MAERRMFTKKIVESDPFTEMPLSAQALYFHLNMGADDDGFVNSPNKIRRSIGAAEDDLRLLIAKRFILSFDNGVIVVKHWRMHNSIRKDRYKPTQYTAELSKLTIKEDGAYTENQHVLTNGNHLATTWQLTDNQWLPQDRLGKDSLGLGEDSLIDKKDIIDKIDKSGVPLSKPNALTNELIKAGYISEDDIYIDEYNYLIAELVGKYSFEIIRSCLWYFIKRYKEQPTDEDGNEIENKVAYFRTAITQGAERLERDNNRQHCGVGSWLYS